MLTCYVVLADPGNLLCGIYGSAEGAGIRATALGATAMPCGGDITSDGIENLLARDSMVRIHCEADEEFESVRIERHAIYV